MLQIHTFCSIFQYFFFIHHFCVLLFKLNSPFLKDLRALFAFHPNVLAFLCAQYMHRIRINLNPFLFSLEIY